MKVSILRQRLELMELYGLGEQEIVVGFPSKLGYGVESPREIVSVSGNTLFNNEVVYIKLK